MEITPTSPTTPTFAGTAADRIAVAECQDACRDQLSELPLELIMHIFSFVLGSPETFFRQQIQLRKVNHSFRYCLSFPVFRGVLSKLDVAKILLSQLRNAIQAGETAAEQKLRKCLLEEVLSGKITVALIAQAVVEKTIPIADLNPAEAYILSYITPLHYTPDGYTQLCIYLGLIHQAIAQGESECIQTLLKRNYLKWLSLLDHQADQEGNARYTDRFRFEMPEELQPLERIVEISTAPISLCHLLMCMMIQCDQLAMLQDCFRTTQPMPLPGRRSELLRLAVQHSSISTFSWIYDRNWIHNHNAVLPEAEKISLFGRALQLDHSEIARIAARDCAQLRQADVDLAYSAYSRGCVDVVWLKEFHTDRLSLSPISIVSAWAKEFWRTGLMSYSFSQTMPHIDMAAHLHRFVSRGQTEKVKALLKNPVLLIKPLAQELICIGTASLILTAIAVATFAAALFALAALAAAGAFAAAGVAGELLLGGMIGSTLSVPIVVGGCGVFLITIAALDTGNLVVAVARGIHHVAIVVLKRWYAAVRSPWFSV